MYLHKITLKKEQEPLAHVLLSFALFFKYPTFITYRMLLLYLRNSYLKIYFCSYSLLFYYKELSPNDRMWDFMIKMGSYVMVVSV